MTAPEDKEAIYVERLKYVLRNNTIKMSEKEQFIIQGRFGFAGRKFTLLELGQQLSLSKERIRQIQADALGKLKIGLAYDPVLR